MQALNQSLHAHHFLRCMPTIQDTLKSQKQHIPLVKPRRHPRSLFYKVPFTLQPTPTCLPIMASAKTTSETGKTPSEHQPNVVRNPDGTVIRRINYPTNPPNPNPDPHSSTLVVSKDIPMNPANQTWMRVFLPKEALLSNKTDKKLPVFVYYHGGGFVFASASTTMVHDFCCNMVTELGIMVVSVEFRLAPENPLPAAYEDAVEAVHFVRTTQEHWIKDFADLSSCYLMGSSCGGNMVFHAGVTLSEQLKEIEPVKIAGLIMHDPFFGGIDRTPSELNLPSDVDAYLADADLLWECALPAGADRNHVYSNPMVGSGPALCDKLKAAGLPALVTGRYGDTLVDRSIQFAKMLEAKGVQTMSHFAEGTHSIEVFDPSRAGEFFVLVKDFMSKCETPRA